MPALSLSLLVVTLFITVNAAKRVMGKTPNILKDKSMSMPPIDLTTEKKPLVVFDLTSEQDESSEDLDSEAEEEAESKANATIKQVYSVYLLKNSCNNCTYIGSTNNLIRRLRQHNGEIVGSFHLALAFVPAYSSYVPQSYRWCKVHKEQTW